MPADSNHIHAIKDGEIFHVDDVPNGQRCNCVCSKCKEPLVAKNGGNVYAHHFAHKMNSNCTGESLAHMEAKEIIRKNKYLMVPFLDEPQKRVIIDEVEVEKLIGNSNYRADIICKSKEKEFIVEIVVSHDLEKDKGEYIIKNEIPTLTVDLSGDLDNYNKLPDNFSEIVLETSQRKWFYNKKEDDERIKKWEEEQKEELAELEREMKLETEKRKKWEEEHKEELAELEQEMKRENKVNKMLDDAFNEIWKKNGEKLIYGKLTQENLKKYGNIYKSTICVKSKDLSKIYENLAIVFPFQKRFKPYLGKKVGIKIIFEYEESEIGGLASYRLFPHCVILWMDGKSKEELEEIRDENSNKRYLHHLNFHYSM